ncbi:MAG TPA: ribulose-phosphate 3-epimerase, partial [Bacteroidales bacterium]|nr:ribulose-phosphate 3-epimerase [Bacteroidales bacterium]
MKHLVAPSLLSANFSNLGKDIEMVNNSLADWFHLDIMDGVFVPNISFGFPVVKAIKKLAVKPLDVHLMIVEPDRYIQDFKEAGADILTVQYEACVHLHRTVHSIREAGMKAGIALNPHTPVSLLENIVRDVDLLLVMSVNPGFGGQKFIQNTYEKIARLKELLLRKNSQALIEVDGGVGLGNARQLINDGVDVLVAGNAIFSANDPA